MMQPLVRWCLVRWHLGYWGPFQWCPVRWSKSRSAAFFMLLFVGVHASSVSADTAQTAKQRWITAINQDDAVTLMSLLNQRVVDDAWKVTASNGKTALMVAAKVGHRDLAARLVTEGSSIHRKTITAGTAFMFAILGDQLPMAQWLASRGANVNAQGSNGWTSVMIASAKGLDSTLAWLLEQGADSSTTDVYGFSPLMRAVDNGHIDAVRLLLSDTRVQINWQDELGNTALHYAVSNASAISVALLIDAGASVHIDNWAGTSPLALAREIADKGRDQLRSDDPQVAALQAILAKFKVVQ